MGKISANYVYLPNTMYIITMMLDNRNMQISIFEINRENIINCLNNLPYLSDSRHLKSKQMYIAIKSLKIGYGL